jgi:hypothetical protein
LEKGDLYPKIIILFFSQNQKVKKEIMFDFMDLEIVEIADIILDDFLRHYRRP